MKGSIDIVPRVGAARAVTTIIRYAIGAFTFGFLGCASASAPPAASRSPPTWPAGVAQTCPQRRVAVECFRRSDIREAMQGLNDALRECWLPGATPVKVFMTIETRGGSATCVEHPLGDNETARCVASTVAGQLVIPDSPPNERCRFRYPVLFQ